VKLIVGFNTSEDKQSFDKRQQDGSKMQSAEVGGGRVGTLVQIRKALLITKKRTSDQAALRQH